MSTLCYSLIMNIRHVSLKDLVSFRIGGEADIVILSNEEDVVEAYEYAKSNNLRLHILGSGTNTVFKDGHSSTLIAKMEMKGSSIKDEGDSVLITYYAGEDWDDVVKYAVSNNLWGIENLSYIPGTVGASPVQNIGAYGSELSDVLFSVRAYDSVQNEILDMKNEDCNFSYRDSIFKKNPNRYCITSVTLRLLKSGDPILTYKPLDRLKEKKDLSLKDIREEVIRIRTSKLPDYNQYGNAGSFFKNPILSRAESEDLCKRYLTAPVFKVDNGYKIAAAWLIEHVAVMKGVRNGNVGTWPTQPLVIVNYGGATFQELEDFSSNIVKTIENNAGIRLEREVNFVE